MFKTLSPSHRWLPDTPRVEGTLEAKIGAQILTHILMFFLNSYCGKLSYFLVAVTKSQQLQVKGGETYLGPQFVEVSIHSRVAPGQVSTAEEKQLMVWQQEAEQY